MLPTGSGMENAMNFHVLTLFPDMVRQGLDTSIIGRAMKEKHISLETVNIRDFSDNKHNRVDDYPYGGGAGMVMQAEPVYRAYGSVAEKSLAAGKGRKPRCIYLTPQGKVFNQTMVEDFAQEEELIFLCGHYEGIDERVLEEIVTDYVSIGDYVLTGGELASMVMIDAISRFVPGVLSNEESAQFESMQDNLLEYPHFTRPETWHDKKVPKVLLTGDHNKIEAWRWEQSLRRTKERRPDLMEKNKTLTVAYFSPTEGTKGAAEILAGMLSQNPQYLDLTRRKLRKQKHNFSEKDLLLAAAPVYGGQLPRLNEALFTNLHGENTPCILMTAYGNRHYDNTLAQMRKILEDRGFYCIGAIAPVIPHIYSGKLGKGRPDESDIQKFRRFAVTVKKRLEEDFHEQIELPGAAEPEPKQMKPVAKFWDAEKCNGCQACVQKCPAAAIDKETYAVDESLCINCMRCAKVCPADARSYDCGDVEKYLESNFMERREIESF